NGSGGSLSPPGRRPAPPDRARPPPAPGAPPPARAGGPPPRPAAPPARPRRYRNAALTILDTLCTDRYLAWNTPGWEGVLMHGVYHFHKNLGVDESVMWGEFFFLEAIAKVLGIRRLENSSR